MSESYEVRIALESSETVATVIHSIIRERYGMPAYDWDVLTVYLELKEDFRAEPSSETMNRWAALQTVMTSDAFFARLDAFLSVANTLAAGEPYFQVFDPVTVEEAAWTIAEVSMNRELLPFSYAIKQYLKQILRDDGYTHDYPAVFDHVFEPEETPSLRKTLQEIRRTENHDNVEAYIDDQLRDMISQFNKIPSLSNMDEILLQGEKETLVAQL